MSAGQTVSITLTIDEANALKAWGSQHQQIDSIGRKLRGLKSADNPLGSLTAGAKNAMSALGSLTAAITGIGSALAGVIAIANQVKNEVANLQNQQADAGKIHVEMAPALTEATANMGGLLTANQIQFRSQEMGKRLNQSPGKLQRGMAAAGAALGPTTDEEAEAVQDTVEQTSAAFPLADEQVFADMVKSVAGLQKNYGISAKEAIGAVLATAQNSAVVKEKDIAAHIAPTISTISRVGATKANPTAGGTLQESAGLIGAITNLSEDKGGETSKTTAVAFASELNKRIGHLATGYLKQVEYLENNPKVEETFWKGGTIGGKKFTGAPSTGDAKNESLLMMMTKKDTDANKELHKRVGVMGGKSEWVDIVDKKQQDTDSNPTIRLEQINRAVEAGVEQQQMLNAAGAKADVARKGLVKLLDSIGELDISKKMSGFSFEMNTAFGTEQPVEEVIGQLEAKIQELETVEYDDGMGYGGGVSKTPEQARKDQDKAEALRSAVSHLRTTNEGFRRAQITQAAEVSLEQAKVAVNDYSKDQTPTAEEAAAVKARLSTARGDVGAYHQDQTSRPGGPDRAKESMALLQKVEASEQRLSDLQKTDDARVKVREAGDAVKGFQTDTTPTEEERSAVLGKLDSAKAAAEAGRSAGGSDDLVKMFGKLSESIDGLRKDIDANRKTVDDNTKATEANSGAQGGASTSSPPRRGPLVSDMQQRKT